LDIAIKLFGINSLFGSNAETPLLEKLNNTGTLFIKNIHYLDLETQEHLAEYIKFGVYRIFKSDQKATSNARIICSSTLNLQTLVQEGKFSQALFNELKATTLIMPSLLTLPEQELDVLAQDLTEQTLKTVTFKNLLELTDKERQKILQARPASIHELKTKIQQLLINKSKKNHIYQETEFDPAYDIGDPELAEAARLGKHALKDPRIMALLWNKFKNQNKIAQFLDVNRSSVNRRCKEYNLF
jgi:DNA-binding NtrC family response regulator